MSLFPAYSDKNITDDTGTADWLVNSSFQANVPSQKPIIDISSGASSEDESTTIPTDTPSFKSEEPFYDNIHEEDYSNRDRSSKRAKKRKKEHRKHSRSRKKEKIDYDRDVENVYFEDNYRDKGNNMVNTLCSRVRPYYETGMKSLGFLPYNKIKKDAYQRYYTYNIDYIEKTKKKDTIIKRESTKEKTNKVEDVLSWCVNLEEEHTLKTREFNEKLINDPNNINIWLQYIELQDTFVTFQKNQLPKDLQRAAALKKLSIVEKALEKNADSTELLKLRLSLMAELMPADQFSNDINALVNKDSGNIILWQALIMATQGSVALCTVPKVLDLYTRCFCVLRQHSRTNPRVYDERLLEILHQCLTFLRHTGLWEQMWETIRLNLILNLNLDKKSLFFKKIIDEKKLSK